MSRLAGRVALVTGGAQGLGGATARRLADAGARVVIADIDFETAQENVRRIRSHGNEAEAVEVDVSKPDKIREAVRRPVDLWGRLDILVSNAYNVFAAHGGGAVDLAEEAWDEAMAVLIKPIFLGAKYAIPEMRKVGGGSVVNVASVHGLLMAPGRLAYETGKAAVIGATRQLATEYGPDGIRVNAVLPGHILTERLQAMWDSNPSGLRFIENQYPLRRAGQPDDIAHAIVFLCSDEASFITGHPLVVDGGHSIQLQEDFGLRQAEYLRQNPDTVLQLDFTEK